MSATMPTFDTLRYANRLKAAGVPAEQAEAQAMALAEVSDTQLSQLVTKADLRELESSLRGEFAGLQGQFNGLQGQFNGLQGQFKGLRGEVAVMKWMLGVIVAGVTALILRTFF